jgi:hypothetical protein
MKLLAVISSTGLLLLLGITAPLDAQQEQPAKPPKQEQQAKPEQQRQQQERSARPEQQQSKGQQDEQRQQQDKSARQEQQRTQQRDNPQQVTVSSEQKQYGQEREQRGAWQEHRAHSWQSEHRDWRQRGGYIGYRIPDDHFRGHFGRDHGFRVYSLPVLVVGGYPRFQYGGFWFSLVDPWPEYWSDNWYDSDDVYVDYSDEGYYLYNQRHPGDRIAISVYVN